MTPETNPVHPCWGCQSCLVLLVDLDKLDGPPPCGLWPQCADSEAAGVCRWPGCADVL